MMIGDNIPLTHFLGATLLIVDWFVFPRFLKPDEGYLSSAFDVNPFQRALREEEAPDFNLFEFFKALSLACDSMVTPSIQWSYIPDDELVNVRGAGGGFSYRNISSHGTKVRISDDQLQDAKRLYQALMELNPATKEKLEVPISRWIESKSGKGRVDQIIDLGIALECLYLQDAGPELRFRLAIRAAWHLGADATERELLAKQFRAIYDIRSKAVHAGMIPDTVRVGGESVRSSVLNSTSQDLCLQAIRKVVDEQFPEWDKLVLG